jgi:outer membrane lipoprotein-sorting protein
MKYIFLSLALLLSFVSVVSGQYLTAKDSDPEAISLMTKVGQAFDGRTMQVNFKLKVTYQGQPPVTTDGILYQSGKSYNLDLKDYAIISDGKLRWVYLKGPNEVNIYNESNGQDWISPQDFLKLHTSPDLVFTLAGIKGDVSIIEAKPLKGRFDEYSKFTIGVSQDHKLTFIYAISSDGTRQELNITSLSYPAALDPQKFFTFNKDKYPGVHVEDLRLD